jgi:hypothetical protein
MRYMCTAQCPVLTGGETSLTPSQKKLHSPAAPLLHGHHLKSCTWFPTKGTSWGLTGFVLVAPPSHRRSRPWATPALVDSTRTASPCQLGTNKKFTNAILDKIDLDLSH